MMLRRRLLTVSIGLLIGTACDSALEPKATRDSSDAEQASSSRPRASLASSTTSLEAVSPASVFEHVIERARQLAGAEYAPPESRLPDALTRLDYDTYRLIAFRPEAALWQDRARFAVQLVHPGFLYLEPVRIHEVRADGVVPLRLDPTMFHYRGTAAPVADVVTPELGHAGFRVYYPLSGDAGREEVAVFLGASYFRVLGRGHVHGLSSRGLAIDIGLDSGEEFPVFREFWLVRPESDAETLTFYALLDSASVTGAYRFDLEARRQTEVSVESRLFARRDVSKLGVAPLSSMFLYGQNRIPTFDDYRPQVHDSDGLMMQTAAGEWIWRPLGNGPGLQVTSLRDHTPRGFGLVQRDRRFDSYLDLEANYHRRPSEWIETREGDWGSGGVELLTIPTDSEFNDNIAAYWVPDEPFRVGTERRFRYRLTTFDDRLDVQTLAQVERTRVGWDALPDQREPPPRSQRQFVVDFGRGDRPALESDPLAEAVLETTAGAISDPVVQRLPDATGWRATFRLTPEGDRPADMRLYLELNGQRLSETWSYVWYPRRGE